MKPFTLIEARGTTGDDGNEIIFDRYFASMAVFEVTEPAAFTGVVKLQARAYKGGALIVVRSLDLNAGTEATDITGAGLYRVDTSGIFSILPTVTTATAGTVTVKVVYRRG